MEKIGSKGVRESRGAEDHPRRTNSGSNSSNPIKSSMRKHASGVYDEEGKKQETEAKFND